MSEFADAAPVAAEPVGVPIEAPVSPPAPIDSRGPDAPVEPPKPEPKRTVADSIRKADAEVRAKAEKAAAEKAEAKPGAKPEVSADAAKTDVKPEAKPTDKPAQPRGEQGRFAGQEPPADTTAAQKAPHDELPRRFTEKQAQAEWANAPESVRKEIHRTLADQENGIRQYQERLKEYDTTKEFFEAAKTQGREPRDVIETYVGLDRLCQQDLPAGLDKICRNMGVTLNQVARHILGIPQDAAAVQRDSQQIAADREKSQFNNELQEIKRQLQEQREQQDYQAVMNSVSEFSKTHPRMEELADEIAREVSLGFDLTEAYTRADRLNPVLADASNHADRSAQTRIRADRSISGAPSAGSDPGLKPVSKNPREALERAARQLA